MRVNFDLISLDPDLDPAGATSDRTAPIMLEAPGIELPGSGRGQGWLQAAALCFAAAAHAAALALFLSLEPDQLGEEGTRLEAISVSIVVTTPNSAGVPEPHPSMPQPEPPVESAQPVAEAEHKKAEPVESEVETPRRQEPERAPPEQETRMTAGLEKIEPDPDQTPPERTPDPPPPPPQPAAAPAPPPMPKSVSTSIASAGVMRAYAKRVALALARSKPKGIGRRGTVRLRFVVGFEGRTDQIELVQSSGQPKLDNAALSTIHRIALPAPPPSASIAQRTFVVPFEFR
jgi:protein TonB